MGDLIAGTIQGSAVDVGERLRPPNGVTVTLGDATREGTVQRTAFLTIGRIAGSIAFKDAANATGTCAAAEWLMEPVSGISSVVGLVLPQPAMVMCHSSQPGPG